MQETMIAATTKLSTNIDSRVWEQLRERETLTGKTQRKIVETALHLYFSIPPEIESEAEAKSYETFISHLRGNL